MSTTSRGGLVQFPAQVDHFLLPALVFGLNGHDLVGIQQVAQGVCAVPGLMLLPHAGQHRREQVRVVVGRLGDYPFNFRNRLEIELFSSKKSEAPQLIASKHSISVSPMSYSTPSTPKLPYSSITGCMPAGRLS